jgi:hypothetical protein
MNFKLSLYKHGKNLFILRKNHFLSGHRDRKIISMQILPQALGRPDYIVTYEVISTSEDMHASIINYFTNIFY